MEVGELKELTDLMVSRRERERGGGTAEMEVGELEELGCWMRKIEMEREGLLNGERGAARGGKSGLLEGLLAGEWRRKEGLLESGGGKSEMGKWERER